MSYLDVPRLHFSGIFTANPSTINNTNTNYDPNNWGSGGQPSPGSVPLVLSWNPYGSHVWTVNCTVRSFVDKKGVLHGPGSSDPLIGASINSVLGQYTQPAKLVDLDTDQQSRTRLFGLSLRISPSNSTDSFLLGSFLDTATLLNLWFGRVPQGQGDSAAGATWQSVLENLAWGNVSASPFLQHLYNASPQGLSISIAAYGYQDSKQSSGFTQGSLIGTIGPWQPGEPSHMVAGRYLGATSNSLLGNGPAHVDKTRGTLTLDLSNAVPDQAPGGPPMNVGTMQAVVVSQGNTTPIGQPIDYVNDRAVAAGISQIALTPAELKSIAASPIGIMVQGQVGMQESPDGMYVEVDTNSLTMNPTDTASVNLYATEFGAPKAGYAATLQLMPQGTPNQPINNDPASGVTFPGTVTTDQSGMASITITANNPAPKPAERKFIDGQLYFIGGLWASPADATAGAPLTVKVFNSINPMPVNPTWSDVEPYLLQFYTLYAYMAGIVDLSNYETVKANAQAVLSVINLPISDPGYMPVTREMSRDLTTMLTTWINNGCPA